MDSFEINKTLAALLGMLSLTMGIGFLSGAVVHAPKPAKLGYELPEPDAAGKGPATAAKEAPAEPIAVRLASADAAKGETVAKKCVSCHQFNQGGKHGQGPLLYDIVNRKKGAASGFNYSTAMKGVASQEWDYEALDKFLANPKGYLNGTAMNFAGLNRPDERANIIAYMRTLSGAPAPLPGK